MYYFLVRIQVIISTQLVYLKSPKYVPNFVLMMYSKTLSFTMILGYFIIIKIIFKVQKILKILPTF